VWVLDHIDLVIEVDESMVSKLPEVARVIRIRKREIKSSRRCGCERKLFFSGTELRCLQLEEVFTEAGSDLSMGPIICGLKRSDPWSAAYVRGTGTWSEADHKECCGKA